MKWHIQLTRYAIIGLASNVFGYLLYLTFTFGGIGYKAAMTLVYVVGVIQTFFFNRKWSFRHDGAVSGSFVRYVAVYALGYLLNLGLLTIGVDHLELPHQAVQAVAIFVVATTIFVMNRYWVFASVSPRNAS